MNDSSFYREFWEARDKWYPTWKNGKTDDNALQVDYIRVYAATIKNEQNETYNVGGVGGRYLWQKNCTFDAGRIVGKKKLVDLIEGVTKCGDNCLSNKECSTFSIVNGECILRNDSSLPNKKPANVAFCGYVPFRFKDHKVPENQTNYWIYVLIPFIFIFLIIAIVLFYRYKVTIDFFYYHIFLNNKKI